MNSVLRVFALSMVGAAMTAATALASTGPVWSDDQLAGFASAIVRGHVLATSVGRDPQTGAIYTYVTLAVEESFKGNVAEPTIVIKQLGGVLGDIGYAVADQATFTNGEEVILFLETRPRDRTLYTVALWQGKWTIERATDTGELIATRAWPHREPGAAKRNIDQRSFGAFRSRLHLQNDGQPAQSFVMAPTEAELAAAMAVDQISAPYAFLGPYRWTQYDRGAAIPFDVPPAGNPDLSTADHGVTELNRAKSVWSGLTGNGLQFGPGNGIGRCSTEGNSSGRISVIYRDPCGEISNSGGTLAVGSTVYTIGGFGGTFGGTTFDEAVDGFIVNNDSAIALQFLSNPGCFASVETHELGHVLGLSHTSVPNSIMSASVSFNACQNSPVPATADDAAGIQAIYPANTPTAPTAPGAPTGFGMSAAASTVLLSWSSPTSGGLPTSYTIEAGTASGLTNIVSFATGSAATTFSVSGVPNGTYYVRVRATNAVGVSPPSNESVLVVGGCVIPGAPSALRTVSIVNRRVVLAWNAATGSPSSYVVEVGSASGLTNLLNLDLGSAATGLTADAPPGTYFVRIRGRNACGAGAVSNEITVPVP